MSRELNFKSLIIAVYFTITCFEVVSEYVRFKVCKEVIADIIVADRKICRILEKPKYEDRFVLIQNIRELYESVRYMKLMVKNFYDEVSDIARDWYSFGIPKLVHISINKTQLQQSFQWNESQLADFDNLVSLFQNTHAAYCKDYSQKRLSSPEVAKFNFTQFSLMFKG